MIVMLLFATAAATVNAPGAQAGAGPTQAAAVAPARATVRILAAARINLTEEAEKGEFHLTSTMVRTEDGSRHPARLVEFQ